MAIVTRVQNLDKAVCFSYNTYTLGKSILPTIISQALC